MHAFGDGVVPMKPRKSCRSIAMSHQARIDIAVDLCASSARHDNFHLYLSALCDFAKLADDDGAEYEIVPGRSKVPCTEIRLDASEWLRDLIAENKDRSPTPGD